MKKIILYSLIFIFLLLSFFYTPEISQALTDGTTLTFTLNTPTVSGTSVTVTGSYTYSGCANVTGYAVPMQVYMETISGNTKYWTLLGSFTFTGTSFSRTFTAPSGSYRGNNGLLYIYPATYGASYDTSLINCNCYANKTCSTTAAYSCAGTVPKNQGWGRYSYSSAIPFIY